jgi:hypothetical protein
MYGEEKRCYVGERRCEIGEVVEQAGRKQLRKAGTTQLITSARRNRSRHTHARKTFIFLTSSFQSTTTSSVLAMITLMLRHYLDQRCLPRASRHCSALHFLRYSPTDLSHAASSSDSTLASSPSSSLLAGLISLTLPSSMHFVYPAVLLPLRYRHMDIHLLFRGVCHALPVTLYSDGIAATF